MPERETIAVVLAGGGARGAYEAGALSVLVPALEQRGQRPRLIIGTSVGALNAAFLAAHADRPVDEVVAEGDRIWREVSAGQVLSPLASPRGLRRELAYLAEVLGLPVRATSILDTTPLAATLRRLIPFDRLAANVAAGIVQAAVVATAATTSRSVVFHTQRPSPPRDDKRAIDYVRAELTDAHVRASAAIPVAFPAVEVEQPSRARGWYFDGGTRLNTPIKPALSLGADRVVVVALNAIGSRRARPHPEPPDLAEGATQLVQAVLVDQLVNDAATLATQNRLVAAASERGLELPGRRSIPYMFVAPRDADAIGRIAARVYNEHYASPAALLRSPEIALLGRAVDGGRDPIHGELLSYLFFAPEFTSELLRLGRHDAQRWLDATHDDGPWSVAPLP
jgi:NTE family protein